MGHIINFYFFSNNFLPPVFYIQGEKGQKGEIGLQGLTGTPGMDVGVIYYLLLFIFDVNKC